MVVHATWRRTASTIVLVGAVILGAFGVTATPAAASPYGGFAATCSTDPTTGVYWAAGLSWSEFVAQDSTRFSQGWRISQIDIEGHDITAMWQPGSGTQWIRTNMSIDSFKSWDTTYFNQGLRLVDVDRDGNDWTAVWRPGSGAQRWRSGIGSWLDFKNQDQIYFDQGMRLVDVIITANNNIMGVWRGDQGNSGQLWQSGILATGVDSNNESEFQRLNRMRRQAGWELKILKTHPNDAYVMGVWRYRGGSFTQATGTHMTTAAFKSMVHDCRLSGRRVHSIDVK